MVKVIQLIETHVTRGNGTEQSPMYLATQYWTFAGELLWETPEPVLQSKAQSSEEK